MKYIFTSENLSVQVHPRDAHTRAKGQGAQGKEECWPVIDAQPGALRFLIAQPILLPDAS